MVTLLHVLALQRGNWLLHEQRRHKGDIAKVGRAMVELSSLLRGGSYWHLTGNLGMKPPPMILLLIVTSGSTSQSPPASGAPTGDRAV